MVQAKTHVDLVKPSPSMSAVKNQYMDFARERLRSSGSYETQNTASGNRSLFVRSSSIANTPTSLMEKNSAGGAPEFSNWKNPEVTSSGKLSNKMSSKSHPSAHHNDQSEGIAWLVIRAATMGGLDYCPMEYCVVCHAPFTTATLGTTMPFTA
ncbi:unnamed protein product [Sphagnum jensenii]|uniref:Uncharacterized protein n=1 Tax=Sphagnum jensenii TaxID=128206 RepID=A0ABP0WKZ3_9BRYO